MTLMHPCLRRGLLLTIYGLALGTAAAPVHADADDIAAYYLRYAPQQRAAVEEGVRGLGGRVDYRFPRLDTLAVSLPAAAAPALAGIAHVVFHEPVPEHRLLTQTVPWNVALVQALDVWDADRDGAVDPGAPDGSGMKLCVIDTGIHATHEDFAGVSMSGLSQIRNQDWDEDGNGHGTHVTGTANAVYNDIGVVGAMPGGAELFIVKIFDNNGNFRPGQSNLGAAAQACRDAGASVINMSLGGGFSSTENDIFQDLYDNFGILSVAAAGNDGNDTRSYPASYDSVISVAALREDEQVAEFSQFPESSHDPENPPGNVHWDVVELSAGGYIVPSTWPRGFDHRITVDETTHRGPRIVGTPLGSASGPLVDGGLCRSDDGDGGWSGAVVLCERGEVLFSEKINEVGDNGGLAAVIYNNETGNFLGTCVINNVNNCTTDTPAISLSQADGQTLVTEALGLAADFVSLEENVVPAGGYHFISGTSMSTPGVAGGAALIWGACGGPSGISNKDLRQLLRDSTRDLEGTHPEGSDYGAGWDPVTGWGVLQLADALELALERFGSVCEQQEIDCVQDLVLENETVSTEETFEACNTITVGPDFTVTGTGKAIFRAGQAVILTDGFLVEPGGRVETEIDPSLATAGGE